MIPIFCPKCQSCVGIISTPSPAPKEGIVLEPSSEPVPAATLSISTTDIDWGEQHVRIINMLRFDGIKTIGDLILKTEAELLRAPNFGVRSLEGIRSKSGAPVAGRVAWRPVGCR
jgi:DNA-directed RNA polymerase alpha subunit